MRRATAWALGGILAGTALLGTGGTLATFSDSESLSATAGAGRVSLADPSTPGGRRPQQLTIGPKPAALPVHPEVVGSEAMLRLWAVDGSAGDPCSVPIEVTVTLPAPHAPVTADLCTLAGRGVDLLPVDSTSRALSLPITASVTGGVGPAAAQWSGALRLTLGQPGGSGFSDEQRLPVHIVVPNQQGRGGSG